jgi:hypothetical protein
MLQKHSDHENIEETEKPNENIREILGAIVLFTALIIKTVFHKQDYDTVFDAGGKAAIIVLMLLFLVIYYIQIKRNDKGQK